MINKKIFKNFSTKTAFSSLTNLVKTLPQRDALMVSSQKIKWTAHEVDAYSSAFARHLVECGLQPGNKFLIWSDINHSAEIICATLGAWKAGLTVVHSEYENSDEIKNILKNHDISSFMFSPYNSIENLSRLEHLMGKPSAKLPNHTIQISHKSLNGMIKFKQAFNYATNFNTNIKLPEIKEDINAFEIIRSNDSVISLNHGQVDSVVSNTNIDLSYGTVVNSAPGFYPISLTLGFLANLSKKNYVVFPGTYSLKDILQLVKNQNAEQFICEGNLLDLNADEKKLKEISSYTENVNSLIVFGEEENLKNKDSSFLQNCFPKAKMEFYDEFTMRKFI